MDKLRFHIRQRNIYLYILYFKCFTHIELAIRCIMIYVYHVTASLRIRHATQAVKPGRSGESLRAVLFDAERSVPKRMGNFAPRASAERSERQIGYALSVHPYHYECAAKPSVLNITTTGCYLIFLWCLMQRVGRRGL